MKKSYILLLASAFSLLTACSKKETVTPASTTTALAATINSAQQVPANSSTATGNFTGTYDSSNRQLSYTVTFQGIMPSNAHIHTGAPGTSGSVAIPFASLTSPIIGTATLTADQANSLLNNGMYVNMHSTAFPNGEIRGDIHKQ